VICCRCGHVILCGEPWDENHHDRASAGPYISYSHRGPCPDKTPAHSAGGEGGRRQAP
jgi:hypothetical protein